MVTLRFECFKNLKNLYYLCLILFFEIPEASMQKKVQMQIDH